MKKNGFTFIETLLVIAIISSLSVFGLMKISAFQEDAKIDSVANEVLSTLKVARNKSELGEIPSSSSLDDYLPDQLPSYGVRSKGDGYEIFVQYQEVTSTFEESDSASQTYEIPSEINVSIPSGVVFERLSGKTNDAEIGVFYKGILKKKILIKSSGYFEVEDA